jgi:serine/threonine-protein kinase
MNCLQPLESGTVCPRCGFPRDFVQELPGLPLRTLLDGRYAVGKTLEFGGDGISYVGWDTAAGRAVRLREFFPDAVARRTDDSLSIVSLDGFGLAYAACLDSFRAMWSKLEQMRGLSGLLPVLKVFEENGTVYAVQEACEGSTLREFLLLRSVTGTLAADSALRLLAPLLPALAALHSAGILHLGISPSSVIVTPERKICLTGFSIWQARTAGGGLRSELYPGYAAPEQYGLAERQGPWTDVYAAAGLYYRVLVGSDPIEATLRVRNDRLMIPGKLAEQIPAYVVNALTNALDINPHTRTDGIERFRAEINAAPDAVWANTAAAAPHVNTQNEPDMQEGLPAANPGAARLVLKTAALTLGVCLIAGLILSLSVPAFRNAIMDMFSPSQQPPIQMPVTTDIQPGNYEVPDFVALGKSYTDVLSTTVWTQRFKFETVFDYSSDVQKNQIIEQSVAPGDFVPLQTPIILKVSKGPEMVTVPMYIGYNIDEIRASLEQAGFKLSIVTEANDGSHSEGSVVWGTLPEGSRQERGAELFLHVYDAPEPTEPPETEPPATTSGNSGGLFPWWPF